jgi:hypothetical protein
MSALSAAIVTFIITAFFALAVFANLPTTPVQQHETASVTHESDEPFTYEFTETPLVRPE